MHLMTADFTQSEPQKQTTLEGQPVANMVSIEVKGIMTIGLKEIVVCIIYIYFFNILHKTYLLEAITMYHILVADNFK